MTTPMTDADYWRMKDKLTSAEALLRSLPGRGDLDPSLRAEMDRCQRDKVGHYRLQLKKHEDAHPHVLTAPPPPQPAGPHLVSEDENWLQGLVDAGIVDSLPSISDEEADAFRPIPIDGRPVSEDIIEGRR